MTPVSSLPALSPRRLAGVAMVLALCAGQLVSLVHLSVVSHTTCADHGEMVHAHAPGAVPVATQHAEWSSQPSTQLEDEHCGTWSDIRPLLHLPQPLVGVAPRLERAHAGLSHAALLPSPRQRFRVAPKQSPPA